MNWLHGKPSTENPRSAYFSWIFSRPVYCGVRPHFEATFTTSVTLPFCSDSMSGLPSRVLIGRS